MEEEEAKEAIKNFFFSKKIKIISIILIVILLFWKIFITKVNPGETAVVVNLLGENKGIQEKELGVGVHFLLPWKNTYIFPTYEQNHQWLEDEGFNFQTAEGLSVHASIGISYHLIPDKINELFCKYRKGMEEITHLFIKNNIRDAMNIVASKMLIEDLYGPKKEEFFKEVRKIIGEELEPLGFIVTHIYIVGQIEVPSTVIEALNKKIEATQRAQQRENELRESEAQAKKEIAIADGVGKSKIIAAKANAESILIEAKARSQANNILSNSLTNDLLKWEAISKWEGKLPQLISNDGISFLLDLKK